MSVDHRRQSITPSKKRRPSLHLERGGTIRRESKLPLLDTGERLLGRKREDSISEGVTDQKDGDTSVTDHCDTTETTEQGPPTARVNTFFPADQPTGGGVHESAADKQARGGTIRRESKLPLLDTGERLLGRKREDSISEGVTDQKDGDTSVTDHCDTTETTEQGPPTARVNTFFPADQPTGGGVHESAADKQARGGTIRRESKLPLLDTGERLLGRKREDSISEGVTDQKDGDTSVTDHCDTTETTEQGPPTARVNTFFPADQPTGGGVHESAADKQVEGMSEAMTGAVRRMSEVPLEASEVFDSAFVKKSKWSTLNNFVHSLQPHKGGGCSQVVHEVKNIAEDYGGIPSEDQVKEQIRVMAQHAIDSE